MAEKDTTEHVCTMDATCMPECCAQWRFDGRCANTGGDCRFRKAMKEPIA
jgi:hypothetical protein